MPIRPEFGEEGGQRYPVLRSIQTFLQQMAEGGARAAPTVIKELLQNADDAGATEVVILLDDRERPAAFSRAYADMVAPALLVRNSASFRLPTDVGATEQDDFSAIRDVAGGHKRAQATAAGRFGIGFNSVYFLTDTPLVFSRREVHIFDLLHKIFAVDGWRFPLDEFPAAAQSRAGEAKAVLAWSLPGAALGPYSFDQLAGGYRDYKETVFRLPLRAGGDGDPALYDDRFTTPADRLRVLSEMADEAARSILFLKFVRRILVATLNDREPVILADIEATPCPPSFYEFITQVQRQDREEQPSEQRICEFERNVTRRKFSNAPQSNPSETVWRFHVRHAARFDDERLSQLRIRLRRNGERAVPWVTVAVPLNLEACHFDGNSVANWRVFLPLLEEGPCAMVISGAFFIGPSRQRTEYRLNETDEGNRRTEWNQALVQNALVGLLQDISADVPNMAPGLLEEHPEEYLSLFPKALSRGTQPANLTDFLRESFGGSLWALYLRDIWGQTFELWIGDTGETVELDLIPKWLSFYRDRFQSLSSAQHRFVSYALGDAVSARIGDAPGVKIRRQLSKELAMQVLRDPRQPRLEDLDRLLKIVVDREMTTESLAGAWAFARAEDDKLLQFDTATLYVLDEQANREPVIDHLRTLPVPFLNVEWVRKDVGLAALLPDLPTAVENVAKPTAATALALLRRLPADNAHDQLEHDYDIKPVVDFLVHQAPAHITPDLRLGFLVRTAHQDWQRRRLGVILLKPPTVVPTDEAFWEVWARRTFARVDTAFSRELHRLLAAHPTCLAFLNETGCRVEIARQIDAIAIFNHARIIAQDIYDALEDQINEIGEAHGDLVLSAANTLLEVADASWESMDAAQQYTVAALPIHRRPDGRFVSMVPASGGDIGSVRQVFRLQSQDDIEDAPIVLSACELLQTANPVVKRFYRRRLHLEEHGRVAVLKDVLHQIGDSDQSGNRRMLQYVARYYEETLRRLELTGDETDKSEAREIASLFESARTVPCIDGEWRKAGECVSASLVGRRLAQQNWPRAVLPRLIGQLFHDAHIATLDGSVRSLIMRLHRLSECDERTVASRAVASEGAGLSLAERVKMLLDNWGDYPQAGVQRSEAAGHCEVPVVAGRELLAETEFFEEQARPPLVLLRLLAPTAVDIPQFAKELAVPMDSIPKVLQAFGVPRLHSALLYERLVERFSELWPALTHGERFEVLVYVGSHGLSGRLGVQASQLETILVATQPLAWRQPAKVVSPLWMETQPPFLPQDTRPALDNVSETAKGVWRDWAGVQTFAQTFQLLLAAVHGISDPRTAAKTFYRWLERAVPLAPPQEALACLKGQPWFLAQRGQNLEFLRPPQVLLHPGDRILVARFWVPALPLPELAGLKADEIGFISEPPASVDTLRDLAECLADRATVDDEAAMHIYQLVVQIIDRLDSLEEWLPIARTRAMFRSFREERTLFTALELFIGDADYPEDVSARLLCLKAGPRLPAGVVKLYRKMGIPDVPKLEQVVAALCSIEATEPKARSSYARLVRTLENVTPPPGTTVSQESMSAIRVFTCAGTYEPVSRCLWDEEFGRKGRVSSPNARRLVDGTDRSTQNVVQWLRDRRCVYPANLRAAGRAEPSEEPQPMMETPEISHLLLPWKQWFQEAAREGSLLRERLGELHLATPTEPLKFVPVREIRVRFWIDDDQAIEQAPEWHGPLAFAARSGLILVRPLKADGLSSNANEAAQIDYAVAREIGVSLGDASIFERLQESVDEILATLERPSTVLRRLRETYRQHFLHQYHDQVADPEFADVFEEYQRTVRGSKRSAELEERMHVLLARGFVQARREQIRGYGYDEFSVFTELLQNAEDAYIQRAQLGIDLPDRCAIEYCYLITPDGTRVLDVEHEGRPFNYWQHGARQNRGFSRDVEGVLRSAGSFKPHSSGSDVSGSDNFTIGRFGLGFKSVYLLTDCPEIHSGSWHFAIEAGCLPVEVAPPMDLSPQKTRIRLALRKDVRELNDPAQLSNVLPFLRVVNRLLFSQNDTGPLEFTVDPTEVLATESVVVETIEISSTSTSGSSAIRVLRCRSREHAGQLAILLTQDDTPGRWNETFNYDLFAVLPLKARLGCGVAVSNRFEVQSGRTHLVDPAANARLVDEVASLLGSMIRGLQAIATPTAPLSIVVARFWALWRWDRGDAECEFLRRALAKTLVSLADHLPIAPTLDPLHVAMLGAEPCFYFYELPDAFRDALIAEQVSVPIPQLASVPLTMKNVVIEGFAGAYSRACEYAGVRRVGTLRGIGWSEVAEICRARPWFGEKPQLLNHLANCLGDDQMKQAATWVALCPVAAMGPDGEPFYAVASELVQSGFPGSHYIPRRLLQLLSSAYDEHAIELLKNAGLNQRPSSDDIRRWVNQGILSMDECVDLLRYLAEDDRFREEYWDLSSLMQSPWFPAAGTHVSSANAATMGLIPEDVLTSDVFRAWLGLVGAAESPTQRQILPDPRLVLQGLFEWWQAHGPSWTFEYERCLYPTGAPPIVGDRFNPRDLAARREWILLFLLGALHTMGRTKLGQHREFIVRCDRRGWFDVFADPEHDARRWMHVLEEYLDDPTGRQDYYQWMKQFVAIFQVSRWLPVYVESVLNVNRVRQPFALDQIFAPRTSELFSGTDLDAPPLARALGMGASFVLRELARMGILRQPNSYAYCYVAPRRVCLLLEHMGAMNLLAQPTIGRSPAVHAFLVENMPDNDPTFGLAFDLPLLALAESRDLQNELLGHVLPRDGDGENNGSDWNGR